MLENPVGRLSTLWRKPDYYFNPNEYAGYLTGAARDNEAYTKKTCLWTSKNFIMPPKMEIDPVLGTKMHTLSPGPDRANQRSETPKGFSKAMYLWNQLDDPMYFSSWAVEGSHVHVLERETGQPACEYGKSQPFLNWEIGVLSQDKPCTCAPCAAYLASR